MNSSLRQFRESERRGRGNLDSLQFIEGFLDETLEVASNVLTGATQARMTVIEWQDDGVNLGEWDADANTPAITGGSGETGDYYTVSAAGSTNIDGTSDWAVGDVLQFDGEAWGRVSRLRAANFYEVPQTMDDLGEWDANLNDPALSDGSGTIGEFYRVIRSGATMLDGENEWNALDVVYFDGTAWVKKSPDFIFYVTNRDTSLTLPADTYVIVARLNGEWRVVWASCFEARA